MNILNVSVLTIYSDGAILIGKSDAGEPMKFRVGEADAKRLHNIVPMRNTAQSVVLNHNRQAWTCVIGGDTTRKDGEGATPAE